MTAQELASMLRARRYSGYAMAVCPVHGRKGRDGNPSLSIREGRTGVRLHCFAGCEVRDILATLGLTFHDLGYGSEPEWKKRLKPAAIRPAGNKKPLGPLEATYRYTDAHGELVAEKMRFAGKVFLWRRPQAGGGWLWKVDRATLPLYRLHEVTAAAVVCLVEGEKDADNLAKIVNASTAVTTAPNGAKSWRPEYARLLAGKKVWIIPDFDEPGRVYAMSVANQLREVARSVRVVSVAPAKDVSDYLLQHTPAQLARLFSRAPLWGDNPKTLNEMVPAGYSFDGEGVCKGCGNDIEWWTTPSGKKIPMNPMPGSKDAATAHWSTCTEQDSFRRKG